MTPGCPHRYTGHPDPERGGTHGYPTLATVTVPTAIPPSPTNTQVFPTLAPPTITPIPVRCNQARFVKDVTVRNGTVFTPGTEFTKVWRLQNTGSCRWDASYYFVFVGGTRLGAPASVWLPKVVDPGENVDIAVDMIAPNQAGSYEGNWMLSNGNGKTFGVGSDAQTPVWVQVRVQSPTRVSLTTWR